MFINFYKFCDCFIVCLSNFTRLAASSFLAKAKSVMEKVLPQVQNNAQFPSGTDKMIQNVSDECSKLIAVYQNNEMLGKINTDFGYQ